MMFSATFAPRIQQLAARVMRQPQKLQIDSPQEKHANIKQVLFWADNAQHKRKLLDHWLRDTTINQAIVFASTQIECDGLANDLQQAGFDAVALHGALNQGLRNRRLMALRNGQVQILVATDVAARGIDVPTITHVFNYGLPMKAEDYTHRIGRTGRAGRDGLAVTFAEMRDRRKIFDIEAYTRQPFKAETIPGLEPQQRAPQGGRGDFGGAPRGRDFQSRDRRPSGGGQRTGGFGGGNGGGFGAPRDDRGGFDQRRGNEGFAPRKPGFGDFGNRTTTEAFGGGRQGDGFGQRNDFAPRGDFAPRKPSFDKGARPAPGNGGKVFVPRDAAKKRAYKPGN
jgi:superfamily II DNA/RNA helicase